MRVPHRYLTAGILSLAFAGSAALRAAEAEQPPAPDFGPRPRLLYTAQEIAAWKADPTRAGEIKAVVQRAETILKQGLKVPEKEGQWTFYYACPKDNSTLVPESPERHVCPTCKTVYTDERTQAAYRTRLFNQLDRQCRELGVAYALTGNVAYANPVKEALLKLARLYPTFTRHDRWGRIGLLAVVGGRRYCQHLDEACGVIELAEAYDLIAAAPCLADADRRQIEEKLLQSVVREIQMYQLAIEAINNHQTWFNAAYATVGVVTGDAGLLNDAVHGTRGLLWQVEHSVTEDGLWYEGTNAYHFYALQAIQKTLDAAARAGWRFADNARLKSLWTGPASLAYPDGQIPVFHDSDPSSIRNYASFFRWARTYFNDPVFDELAAGKGGAMASTALKGLGIVALRKGRDTGAACTMIDYGLHGGHHGHPDKLNMVLYALGREWILDPGRISYSVPEYQTWCRTTVAHNTVVLNARDQSPSTGSLLFFEERPGYAACLCEARDAYPGYRLKRFLVLLDRILIDVFTVEGQPAAQMDWVVHVHGEMETGLAFQASDVPGKANGYPHIKQARVADGQENVVLSFREKKDGAVLRMHLIGDAESRLYAGTGIGYRLDDPVPLLIRRRTGTQTAFVTVYDLGGATPAVREVKVLPVRLQGRTLKVWEALGLSIAEADGDIQIGLDLRDAPDEGLDEVTLEGKGFRRLVVQPNGVPKQ